MRNKVIKTRKTSETDVTLEFSIDGKGRSEINTPVSFLNHMLELFTFHGCFDMKLNVRGDTDVDFHHTVEDIGIVLGVAINESLGDKKGISRYASISVPMDEALSELSLDISGRPYLNFKALPEPAKIGQFDTELVEEFFQAVVNNAMLTLHIVSSFGTNNHHIAESIFKGFGIILRSATRITLNDRADSTKWI
ncbi:MAG: imidazoleglycerol-phosphate dehydratase HisB [Actinomycetia bacterium]|nr:imidazoleglycerol-phosphate dehydratase HisB [Actinomycetes bacterium]